MGRKRKNTGDLAPIQDWHSLRDSGKLSGIPLRANTVYFSSPLLKFQYSLEDPFLRYHHQFAERPAPARAPPAPATSHMGKMVPWLLCMSLLGAENFAGNPRGNAVSSIATSSGFPSSLRNYKKLISSHDELPGHITCETSASASSHREGSALDNRLTTTPIYSNHHHHLYGSTPEISERFVGSHSRHGLFRRPTVPRIEDIFQSDSRSVNRLEDQLPREHYDRSSASLEDEYVGPAMELVYAWSSLDLEYGSLEARDAAVYNGDYIAENNLPLGLEIWKDKVFITLPKWKDGIPVTLATVPRPSNTKSPKLRPYPNWEWHRAGGCEGLTSVFRVQVDECDRLWVLDSGKVDVTTKLKQECPPALFIFDLKSDSLIRKYTFPEDQVKEDSLYTNIVVDVRDENCATGVAYMSDVWRFGIVVYDFLQDSSFRVEHHLFFPDPLASNYELHGIKFQWTDGIFGIALSPVDIHEDRTLFFHPMSSFREFAVSTSVLRDKETLEENSDKFTPIGRPRAKDYGHSSGSVVDRNGVMFFNMVTRDSVWCWDTRKEYIPQNLGVIGTSNTSLVFPNDIRVDHEYDQNVWTISNRLPMYLYGNIDISKINYRIYKANARQAVKDTVCDPEYVVPDAAHQGYDETC